MQKIEAVTQGLEYSVVDVHSSFFYSDTTLSNTEAEWVAKSRLDLIQNKVKASFEHDSNDVTGTSRATKNTVSQTHTRSGMITFEIKQKEFLPDGRKPRKLEDVFDKKVEGANPYETFVKRAAKSKREKSKKK
jgi:hypothetical protein